MNEFLDNAVAKLQDEKKSTMKKDPRMNQDDLQHRKFAETQLKSGNFTGIQFLDFVAEKFSTNFFHSIEPEEDSEQDKVIENR